MRRSEEILISYNPFCMPTTSGPGISHSFLRLPGTLLLCDNHILSALLVLANVLGVFQPFSIKTSMPNPLFAFAFGSGGQRIATRAIPRHTEAHRRAVLQCVLKTDVGCCFNSLLDTELMNFTPG